MEAHNQETERRAALGPVLVSTMLGVAYRCATWLEVRLRGWSAERTGAKRQPSFDPGVTDHD